MCEALELAYQVAQSPFAKDKKAFVRMMAYTGLFHMEVAQRYFEKLMQGEEAATEVNTTFNARIADIGKKARRKSRYQIDPLEGVIPKDRPASRDLRKLPALLTTRYVKETLERDDPDGKYINRFIACCNSILTETIRLRIIMRIKPGYDHQKHEVVSSKGKTYAYPPDAIDKSRKNYEQVRQKYCQIFHITQELSGFLSDMKALANEEITIDQFSERWPQFPNIGQDGIGRLSDSSVFLQTSQEQRQRLEAYDSQRVEFAQEWQRLGLQDEVIAYQEKLLGE
jgi:hypothetical protein